VTGKRTVASALLAAACLAPAGHAQTPADLQALAKSYYAWRDSTHPVATSDLGDHRWDSRLADFRLPTVRAQRRHVAALLAQVKAMRTDWWTKDDRVDWLLFRSQLEGADFFGRVRVPEESDPQTYVSEAANGIFSLLKKDYAPRRTRALAAASRLRQVPAMLAVARANLTRPVRLYATLAIASARRGDALYTTSLMTLADSLADPERAELVRARDSALAALHEFADWLERRQPSMTAWRPMGEAQYNHLLRAVLLLPYRAGEIEMLGEVELARYRGLEAMLRDPSLASPDPARRSHVPKDQAEFLAAYESRLAEIVRFLRDRDLVTIPPYIGSFLIRQLPEAFKPTTRTQRASTSSRRTTRPAATSTFAPPSRIPDRSSATRGYPATSCSCPSRTTSPTRSAASTPTTPSSRAGRSTARRC
jgi:hypothetical protein